MERMLEIVAPEEVELGSDPVTWWEEFRTVVPISVNAPSRASSTPPLAELP